MSIEKRLKEIEARLTVSKREVKKGVFLMRTDVNDMAFLLALAKRYREALEQAGDALEQSYDETVGRTQGKALRAVRAAPAYTPEEPK